MSRNIVCYQMVAPGKPLERADRELAAPGAGELLVEVAGCGICHTDLSFLSGQVRTNRPLPLVLGHEVSGTVVEAGSGCDSWVGQAVIVPAVLPCGDCALCKGGRANACRSQKMPGNDIDGGFATHMLVPARSAVRVGGAIEGHELWELAVVADAVTTPYQAAVRAGLRPGDVAVFVGLGGVGGFGVQIASALGATVFGVDVDSEKLRRLASHGLSRGFDARELDARAVKAELVKECKQRGLPALGWKIFETSGTTAGQETAFSLLTHTGTLAIVGFTGEKVTLRLSNLMALDATAFGNWGCDPAHYPAALELLRAGKVTARPFVRRYRLDQVNEAIEAVSSHQISERPVLVP